MSTTAHGIVTMLWLLFGTGIDKRVGGTISSSPCEREVGWGIRANPFSKFFQLFGFLRMKNDYSLHALPGVARQPPTFFASPKKVGKERRPHLSCPFGVPVYASQKMGNTHNSLRKRSSNKGISLSIFCPAQTAASQRNGKNNPA